MFMSILGKIFIVIALIIAIAAVVEWLKTLYKIVSELEEPEKEEEDNQEKEEFVPKDENDPWEKCKSCEFFDGYDICTHKKNFGSVTDESKERCNLLKLWQRKQ